MEEKAIKKYKILYVGGYGDFINSLVGSEDLFEVVTTENGLTAMNFVQSIHDTIDAVLIEAYLPGINGIEIAKMLKGKTALAKTPFIIVSPEYDEKFKKAAFEEITVNDYYSATLVPKDIHTRIFYLKKWFELSEEVGKVASAPRKEYKIPIEKRIFDIVISAGALLVLSPLLLIVAIAIRLESKGKVFYSSKRVGTGYKIFDFYKFRSMRTGADAMLKDLKHLNQYQSEEKKEEKKEENCPRCAQLPEGEFCSQVLYNEGKKICEYWYNETKRHTSTATFIKIKDDPRITKVGKFIRNTSIDELPQLVNVLKGDMSIVGNRPLPLYEAEMLTSDDWSERFLGPAGITGLWQVKKRGKKGEMSDEERKALDNQYARNYSFWGDIKLILRTIPALLQKENV
ncbi:MAG: sugar transferase [Lentimicrobiaceae bacterium]|jgi:lipopolysaccharide/colanic/teichoic acid biosynthesis glycosyltransferase|nr:sugar transferase [Lentimicrobiaceae bacterium]